jgi:hypothetical protein
MQTPKKSYDRFVLFLIRLRILRVLFLSTKRMDLRLKSRGISNTFQALVFIDLHKTWLLFLILS